MAILSGNQIEYKKGLQRPFYERQQL